MPKVRGRKRRSESDWTEILGRFESSGLTIREFCRREGQSLSSFQRWRSRLGSVGPSEFVELVPAEVPAKPVSDLLDVALPNGIQPSFIQ